MTPKVYITRINKGIPLPQYQTDGAVAFDLCAAENISILPGTSTHIHTGLIIDARGVPNAHIQVFPRSSLFKHKKLLLANSSGIIDRDYCGPQDEIQLFVFAPLTREHVLGFESLYEPIQIRKGERLAQARC